MDPDGNLIIYLVLLAVSLFLKAFVMYAKTAIILFPDARIRKLCEEGDPKARRIARLTGEPGRYNDASLLLSHFFTVLITVLSTLACFEAGMPRLISLGMHPGLSGGILAAGTALVTCFLVLTLSTYLPKNMAGRNPEGAALSTVGFFQFVLRLARPFCSLTTWFSDTLSKILGFDPAGQVELVTEEEIRMLVDVGEEKGVIEESQKEMINNIFEFDDTTAQEIMTHRTEIYAVPHTCTLQDVLDVVLSQGYSRIPVYKEDLDNIIGVLYAKDLLKLLAAERPPVFSVENYLRPVLYVPESNRLRELFTQFTEQKVQMAVVVDEYGGTWGIVTMEDVLESIVGNIQDEYDNEEEEFSQLGEGAFSIDGSASLDDVEKELGVSLLDEKEDLEFDTLGGLIIHILGRIPGEEETPTVEVHGVRLTAVSIVDRRIARVQAVLPPAQKGEPEESAPKDKPAKGSPVKKAEKGDA